MELSYDKAVEVLQECVRERGEDFVYVNEEGNRDYCFNWHSEADQPGCIVGLAMWKLGVSKEFLEENYGADAEALLNYLGWDPDDRVRELLSSVQAAQDGGDTYAGSLRLALSRVESLNSWEA